MISWTLPSVTRTSLSSSRQLAPFSRSPTPQARRLFLPLLVSGKFQSAQTYNVSYNLVLQLFLSSPKPALRFAAIRTLNRAASTHAYIVAACNVDMENLITDANRTISTLAITTLLKTGTEASVDRLMKQIEGFMSEISDEFKVVVVEAIRSLCLKFPNKQASMVYCFKPKKKKKKKGGDFMFFFFSPSFFVNKRSTFWRTTCARRAASSSSAPSLIRCSRS